jgi:dolichol-phosphate mannosyltransferase
LKNAENFPLKSGLSIIMPAYNEENGLAKSVDSAISAANAAGLDFEIIIVNDGSIDKTGTIAAEISIKNTRIITIHNEKNMGMGGAFKEGLKNASLSHVMIFAADSEHSADGVLPILNLFGKFDMVIPYVKNPEVRPIHRQIISICYTWVVNILFLQKIPYYNGLVLYRTELLRSININSNSFSFQAEAILKLLKKKATWHPVGCFLQKGEHQKTKAFRIKNIIGVIGTLLRLRISL